MLFDTSSDRAIVSEDGEFLARSLRSLPGYALVAETGVAAGICIPVDSEEGRSWLILTGIPFMGWGHLHLARAIRSEIAQGMEWQTASVNALDSALFRLRRTVACDLHDSVAHSLAGARFLLVALRSRVGEDSEIAREIGTIKDALDAEHLHVRRLIEQLRETDSDPRVRNLVEDLDASRAALASRWQIGVELVDSDFRVEVPVWLSLEVQQLVREAISNGVCHGKASRVAVSCRRRQGVIEIEVVDNGLGFPDPQEPMPPHSISERLDRLGGSLEIRSGPGSTTMWMRIPSTAAD
jgi:signal transduction histidine kinase